MAYGCDDLLGCSQSMNSVLITTNISLPLQKSENDDTKRYVKSCLIIIISSLIVCSNIINIFVIQKTVQLPRITRICILNLSVSDLLVGLISCFPCIIPSFTGEWPYGEVWCQIAGIVHGTSVTISIWSLSLISIDRYFAIVRPLKSRCLLTPKKVFTTIAVLWALAIVTFFAPLPTKSNFIYYKYSKEELICGLFWEYKWFCVITALYIPITSACIIIYTNYKVTKKVITSRQMVEIWRIGHKSGYNEMRAVKLLTIATLVYFISWGPYVVQVIIMSMANISNIPADVRFATLWLANCNSFCNVFVYSAMYKSFRRRARFFMSSMIFCVKSDTLHLSSFEKNFRSSSSRDPAELFD